MSTLKCNAFRNTASNDGGIDIDATGHVTVDGQQLPTGGQLGNRSLIINGAMQVSQRATQVTGVTGGAYRTCDRFHFNLSTLGTWTVDQSTDAPDGFSNSFKATCTTADASPAAGDAAILGQRIEAQNLQHLKFGTSAAESLTLSFYVKSNKTGAASVDMYQPDASNRQISKSYTISSANTWEYKTITFPGDTSGAFNNDNGIGLFVEWWLNSGSDYNSGSLQTTWGALDQTSRNASNLGVGGAVNDYFQITGIQLEVGSKATAFEYRSFGDELARCQRYYEELPSGGRIYLALNSNSTASAYSNANVIFKITKRAAPTVVTSTTNGNQSAAIDSAANGDISTYGFSVTGQAQAAGAYYVESFTASAEL